MITSSLIVPWNLSRHLEQKEAADIIVISPAKAGRTWLHVMINKYLSLRYGVPFSVEDLHLHDKSIPSIHYDHWLWMHLRFATFRQRLRGRYMIPQRVLKGKKLVLLVRDPRDIIVSAYFQESKRVNQHKETQLPLKEFIRDSRRGIGTVVQVLNLTYNKTRNCPRTVMTKYESFKADPATELKRVLQFMEIPVDDRLVQQAVGFADFSNMKKMEQDDAFGSSRLRPKDAKDPESFKVRKGKVGGYKEYFDADDLAYLEQEVAKLDPVFGYTRRA